MKAEKKDSKKIRVLQLSDWSFVPIDEYNASGGDACDVARYGVEYLRSNNAIDLDVFCPDDSKLITKFMSKLFHLEGRSLILQAHAIANSRKYDVIYYPADRHLILLAIARKIRICRSPVLMICHFSFNRRTVESKKKALFLSLEKKLVLSSFDEVMFACDRIMELASEGWDMPQRHMLNCHWGASVDYFDRGGTHRIGDYYMAAGNANRDYKTLIDAFTKLKSKVIICCPKSVSLRFGNVTPNIIFYDIADDGTDHYRILRDLYLNCKAVLIPIDHSNHVPNGATVFAEGLAAGKAIVITDLISNFVDVENLRIGYKAKLHDPDSWIQIINHLDSHQNELVEMGKNAYEFAKKEQNYELFSKTVENALFELTKNNSIGGKL